MVGVFSPQKSLGATNKTFIQHLPARHTAFCFNTNLSMEAVPSLFLLGICLLAETIAALVFMARTVNVTENEQYIGYYFKILFYSNYFAFTSLKYAIIYLPTHFFKWRNKWQISKLLNVHLSDDCHYQESNQADLTSKPGIIPLLPASLYTGQGDTLLL